jgi:hypothetical protein
MALQFQQQQVPFTYGLAEGVDPHQTPPGTLVTAENVVWKKSGRLEKRYGTRLLTKSIQSGGNISAAARLFSRGSEIDLIDGTYIYSFSSGSSRWRQSNQIPEVGLTWPDTLVQTGQGALATDVAYAGGYIVHAWVTGNPGALAGTGALFYQVLDSTSGCVILGPSPLDTSGVSGVRVAVTGSTAYVVYTNGTTIKCQVLNLSTMAIGSGANLRTDYTSGAAGFFDAIVYNSNLTIAYVSSAAAPKLLLYSYNSTLVQQASGSISGEAAVAFQGLSIAATLGDNLLWVAYATAALTRFAAANPSTLVQSVAPVTIQAIAATSVGVVRVDSTHALVAYEDGSANPSKVSTRLVSSAGTVDAASARGTIGAKLLTRPFVLGSLFYVFVTDNVAATGGFYTGNYSALIECPTTGDSASSSVAHRYVGKVDHLVAGQPLAGQLSNVAAMSATSVVAPLLYQEIAAQSQKSILQGVRRVVCSIGSSRPQDFWRAVNYGSDIYLCAGVLTAWDGVRPVDYGFLRPPSLAQATPSTTGGTMAAGTYFYGFTLEYRTATGTLHRSQVNSYNQSFTTTTGTSSVAVNVSISTISNKSPPGTAGALPGTNGGLPVQLPVFRTVASGSNLQRLTVDPGFTTVTVDTTSTLQSFTDTRPDSAVDGVSLTLLSRPGIYTLGGVLGDEQPPAFTTMALHKQRIWGIDGSGRQMWFSKSFLDDYGTAPGFSTTFLVQFDKPVTALASMDEKLIAFWSSGVWYFLGGDNITPNGLQTDLQGPIVVQSDVGCTNPRSVVSVPDGVMFQSDRGIYLLTRGLELVWIGRPIKDTLEAYPSVTSATLVAKSNEVRFTCNNAGTTAGVELRYNYIEKQWSTVKYTDGATYGCPIADATMCNGVYTWVTPSGQAYQEDTTTYLDAGSTWVPMTIETAWLSATGPLSFKSVRSFQLEGVSNTNHDLTISVGFDSDTAYAQATTFAAGTPVTTVGPLEQCEITIGTRRKCQHIRFKIQDATPTDPHTYAVTTGQGPSFDMMGIEFGAKQGFAVNPATKKG